MITLIAHQLCWIKGELDDPNDHCAHGRIEFTVNETLFIKPEDGEWTVSAAGLYLLRTLSFDHEPGDAVTEQNFLFPCCGHGLWLNENTSEFGVICLGCGTGIDVTVYHTENRMVELSLGEKKAVVSKAEWRSAVLAFAVQVTNFYASCTPKVKPDDNIVREGWAAFWQEWDNRMQTVTGNASIFMT